MKTRRGQVALYLVMVLVAIAFLVFMNVGAFLAVTARNRTMNAGDAAALAVAKLQGELLNRIGALNVEHLQAVLKGDAESAARCAEIAEEQARLCFLGPIDGIAVGNEAARANGIEMDDGMAKVLRQHVIDVRTIYAANPESYPPPWDDAWEEYAQRLELAIGGGLWAGPDNVDFVDAVGGHLLLNKQFYNAVAGRNWCWFHFNASGLLDGYSGFGDWGPLPVADEETRRRRCMNSEIYSLQLDRRVGSALDLFGKPLIAKITGVPEESITNTVLLVDQTQTWYCYGDMWRDWWEIDPDGEWQFPVVGHVKPEYNVRGCAAICRVTRDIPDVVGGVREHPSVWSAAAKPFGTVDNLDGELDVVTALKNLVTSAFADVRLVPLDTVGGRDLSTADPCWMDHIREHLPKYLADGPSGISDCYYCQQLAQWEKEYFRRQGRDWLKYNSKSCIRTSGSGGSRGGSAHGH